MNLDLRNEYKWALVAPTSMGVRLTPVENQPVHCSDLFRMQATSAESNVITVSSSLGLPVKILTAFVKGSPIALFIRERLAARHISYDATETGQGGPWGLRHQFNIADTGFGLRGPRVYNDRSGEIGRGLKAKDFDLDNLFGKEGVRILHMSGLIAALSPETGKFCIDAARIAKKNGTKISFDLNHRASFWKGREKELAGVFRDIASLSDILTGNEEDFQLCLGIEGPDAGGKGIGAKTENFKEMIGKARKSYPAVKVFSTTLREVLSSGRHLWGAIMLADDEWHTVEPREIDILDRIGGGDGFVGGLLYGILKEWEPAKCLQFGWAAGAMAVTLLTDYIQPADEEQVWSIWEGNARVKR